MSTLLPILPGIGAGLLSGFVLGVSYFALLRHTVRQFASAGSVGRIVLMTLLRALLAVGVFWGLAQLGAWALLAGLAGFLVARYFARSRIEA